VISGSGGSLERPFRVFGRVRTGVEAHESGTAPQLAGSAPTRQPRGRAGPGSRLTRAADTRHGLVANPPHLRTMLLPFTSRVPSWLGGSDASRTSESLARKVSIRGWSSSSGLSPMNDQA
jgi:hypothetical protein